MRIAEKATASQLAQELPGVQVPVQANTLPADAIAANCGSISSCRQLRVVIVEDEALIALVLAEILEELGFAVCASEATEAGAIAAVFRERPGMMIVDVRLREGSGISAVETILRQQFVPHVFTTGDMLAGFELHPRAVVLQKPYIEAELAEAIQRALGPGPA